MGRSFRSWALALLASLSIALPAQAWVHGAAAAPLPQPFYDAFDGSAASINGRVRLGATWSINPISGSNTTALQVDGSNHLSGGFGTSPIFSFGYVAPSSLANWWVTREFSPNAAVDYGLSENFDHVTTSGSTASGFYIVCSTSCTSTSTGSWNFNSVVAGNANHSGAATLSGISNIYSQPGDTYGVRYTRPTGANLIANIYQNGRLVKANIDATASGVPLTGNFGYRGDIPAASQSGIMIGDPNQQSLMSVDNPWRVDAVNASGGLTTPRTGDYTGGPPATMNFTLINSATEATVTGYASKAMSNFSASGGRWSGRMDVLSTDIPAAYRVRLERSSGLTSGTEYAWTPVLRAGDVGGCDGQSLCVLMTTDAHNTALGSVANYWKIDGAADCASYGTTCSPGVWIDRRVRIPGTADSVAYTMDTIRVNGGHAAQTFLEGGIGNTLQRDRMPGGSTGDWESLVDGLARTGNNLNWFAIYAGQKERDAGSWTAPTRAQFKTDLALECSNIFAITGHAFPCEIVPMGALAGSNDATNAGYDEHSMDIRRAQYETTRENANVVLGPETEDLQHDGEIYHLGTGADTGWAEQARRQGFEAAFSNAQSACDRRGATLEGLNRIDDHTLDALFDLGCASGSPTLEVFVAASNDYRLGFTFSIGDIGVTFSCAAGHARASYTTTDTTACTQLAVPNALPVASQVSGQHWKVRFVFAAATFPATACIGPPWGQDPWGRPWNGSNQAKNYLGSDGTIDANVTTLAARPRTNFGDSRGTKPAAGWYFNPSYTTGDNTHDYFCAS